jgi:alpha-1,3-rhamnosyl/mannosyltransferase
MQTTRAMTVSKTSANDLETILRISGSRIDVVTEGADAVFRPMQDPALRAKARARYGVAQDVDLLVCVGGLNPHKNLLGLLAAMPAVLAERPALHLAIVGDVSGKGFWDNVEELKRFVAAHPPLERHIHFTGFISDADLAELLNAAEALVFPSLWEGFGLPAVEAMSCGLPVLASRRSSLPEVIGDAGLFFEPEDAVDITGCILRFMRDPQLQNRLRARALERSQMFSWERAAELAEGSFLRCR